jgi:hypothetical protein
MTTQLECVIAPTQSHASSLVAPTQSPKASSWKSGQSPTSTAIDHETRFAAIDHKVYQLSCQIEKLHSELEEYRSERPAHQQKPQVGNLQNSRSEDVLPQETGPVQPQFVGPTRSAFGLNVARSSMNSMGIPTDQPHGRAANPVATLRKEAVELTSLFEPLQKIGKAKVLALIAVFEEELHPVYPFHTISDLVTLVHQLFERYGGDDCNAIGVDEGTSNLVRLLDFMVLTAVIACAMAVDSLGPTELSQRLVKSAAKYIFDDVGTGGVAYEELVITTTLVCLNTFALNFIANISPRVSITSIRTKIYWLGDSLVSQLVCPSKWDSTVKTPYSLCFLIPFRGHWL